MDTDISPFIHLVPAVYMGERVLLRVDDGRPTDVAQFRRDPDGETHEVPADQVVRLELAPRVIPVQHRPQFHTARMWTPERLGMLRRAAEENPGLIRSELSRLIVASSGLGYRQIYERLQKLGLPVTTVPATPST